MNPTRRPDLRRSDPRPPDLHLCRSGGLFLSPQGHGTVTIKVFCPTGLTLAPPLSYVYPIAPERHPEATTEAPQDRGREAGTMIHGHVGRHLNE